MDDIDSLALERRGLTNGFFKQLLTISVAGIGFIFALEQVSDEAGVSSWNAKLSIVGFFACILSGLFGQIAVLAEAYRDRSKQPESMQEPKFWIPWTWGAFALGFAGFVSMALVR